MTRKTVRIYIFNKEQFDGDWPPEPPAECMAWFSSKITEVPEEYLGTAHIEFDSESGYEGDHYGRIRIWYERPETDAEMAVRTSRVLAEENQEWAERAALARLKAKYEGRP